MADDITNIVLLEHMQGMKSELQEQVGTMKNDLQKQIAGVDAKVINLAEDTRRGFEDARQHRQALQEDLEATMRMLSKHEAKLARL